MRGDHHATVDRLAHSMLWVSNSIHPRLRIVQAPVHGAPITLRMGRRRPTMIILDRLSIHRIVKTRCSLDSRQRVRREYTGWA